MASASLRLSAEAAAYPSQQWPTPSDDAAHEAVLSLARDTAAYANTFHQLSKGTHSPSPHRDAPHAPHAHEAAAAGHDVTAVTTETAVTSSPKGPSGGPIVALLDAAASAVPELAAAYIAVLPPMRDVVLDAACTVFALSTAFTQGVSDGVPSDALASACDIAVDALTPLALAPISLAPEEVRNLDSLVTASSPILRAGMRLADAPPSTLRDATRRTTCDVADVIEVSAATTAAARSVYAAVTCGGDVAKALSLVHHYLHTICVWLALDVDPADNATVCAFAPHPLLSAAVSAASWALLSNSKLTRDEALALCALQMDLRGLAGEARYDGAAVGSSHIYTNAASG